MEWRKLRGQQGRPNRRPTQAKLAEGGPGFARKKTHNGGSKEKCVAYQSSVDHRTSSRLGLTYPPTEDNEEVELGHQLSLLNLIVSNKETDTPGNTSTALIASIDHDMGWIIDSGAIDHMMYNYTLFNVIMSPPWNNIVTANREVAPVT